ncbi:betaine aldehyde dehydrogenase [Haloarcula quadrata]|uniref:Betaine aldehyde dehydrogenase n=1 Tax=Haloarcula quadrata TaxID=182779 RepID=A0A495QWE3_9EURY|nr:aldehyde dehydrogenase family protein [Haloarcula quadrata]RKS78336.1 betaine aldehyde dehydrogenase [Haloarcula quadrata]
MPDSETRTAMRKRHLQAHEDALADIVIEPWIGGTSVSGSEPIPTRDPVIDEPITAVPVCDDELVNQAVQVAWDGFETWSDRTPTDRSQRLSEWVDVLEEHLDELALLECLDTGKPLSEARGEVEGALRTLEYYAAVARTQQGSQIPAQGDLHMYTRMEPYGVVGQITPWNFPAWAAAWKFGPALAAGNCSVLKPSAYTPLTTVRMAQLSDGIFPDGVINVVTGGGSMTGATLTEHEDVRKLSFTGSGSVGQEVMQTAAARIAPVTLELGGKSPLVVFPDADMQTAVDAAAAGVYYSTGEICDALSRAIVHEDIHDEFVDRLVARAESYTLGDPLDDETTLGPLTNEDQFETVSDYVTIGRNEGATLATGGTAPDDRALADGHYVEPAVFTDVEPDMRIAREEIFGPVQTVQSFETYDEAIALANDTEFGLAGGVATESTDIAHQAAADIDAGVVYINAYGPIRPEGPYGGFKESGIGHDLGRAAVEQYQQPKTVYVNLDSPEI